MTRFRPFIELTVLALIAFSVHFSLLNFVWPEKHAHFRYNISLLYTVFFVASIIIVFGLQRMLKKNVDSLGHTFIWLTCVKAVLAYVLLHPILSDTHPFVASEKVHFFAVFAIFLTIETIVSVRILNRL